MIDDIITILSVIVLFYLLIAVVGGVVYLAGILGDKLVGWWRK